MSKATQSNGRIIYEGPSMLDGSPIVVIAIGFKEKSANAKTGDMLQTYIMRADSLPTEAVQSGDDFSVCGDCIHRGKVIKDKRGRIRNVGRTCYVNLGQGPLGVMRTYLQGKYPAWDGTGVSGKFVRLGTYGDPAAVPTYVWDELLRDASGHTGYTHQWRDPRFASLRQFCMASADTPEEAASAQAKGWRTFRVSLNKDRDARRRNEALCPASAEAGRKLTCAQCLACSGTTGRRGSVYIPAHGGFAVMANIKRRDAALAALQVCNG
jgi:hypothetical protein